MKFNINKIIFSLIASDFFICFAFGLIAPIFAIFILENIDNKIEVIGYATSIYWITRVILVIPFSWLMDKIKGENDEYLFMIIGTFLMSLVPLFFTVSSQVWHIYLLQAISALAHSMAVPAWRILFTNHLDRNIIGFEWSIEDVGVGIATAISASVGAFVADKYGFNILFIFVFILSFIGTLILVSVYVYDKNIFEKFLLFRRKRSPAPFKVDTFK